MGVVICHDVILDGRAIRPIGSKALLGGDLVVQIIGVQIYPGPRVTYRVAWTLDGQRREEWPEEMELRDAYS